MNYLSNKISAWENVRMKLSFEASCDGLNQFFSTSLTKKNIYEISFSWDIYRYICIQFINLAWGHRHLEAKILIIYFKQMLYLSHNINPLLLIVA